MFAESLEESAIIKIKSFLDNEAFEGAQFYKAMATINNLCANDLSSFYLDAIKERLYISKKESSERRAAQATLFAVGSGLARILAPIFSFTCEELWGYLPKFDGKPASVFLAGLPSSIPSLTLTEAEHKFWLDMAVQRPTILKKLEEKRVAKEIGHSLDAEVSIPARDVASAPAGFDDASILKESLIVSKVVIDPNLAEVAVRHTPGEKCARCWNYSESLGTNSDHPELCPRCTEAVT